MKQFGLKSAKLAALCLVGLMTICAATPALAKKVEPPVDPGPQPDLAAAQLAAEGAIKATLFDPGSAEFQWPFAWVGGYWKPVLQGKKIGWWTCGLVNAKNRMGGYVGFQNFAVVVKDGAIAHFEVGTGRDFDFTNMGCAKAVQQGTLKRAEAATAAAQPLDPTKPALGIAFAPAPDGLYISAVEPGYPAALAKIEPGMVISQINGITLKGMPPAAAGQILAATGTDVTLTIIGRGEVKLIKALPLAGGN